jgi:hypothetical protein
LRHRAYFKSQRKPWRRTLGERMTQHGGEPSHLLRRNIDVAVSIHEKQIHLLHLVWQSRRARNEVPVDVRVPDLAPER